MAKVFSVMSCEIVSGDLFKANHLDALAHGCNCAGAMGRGIAVEFKRRWPDMYDIYRRACRAKDFRLGEILPWKSAGPWIYNLATQEHWRAGAELWAIENAVSAMLVHAVSNDVATIGMPKIGAGLGGLDWDVVYEGILRVAGKSKVHIQVYIQNEPVSCT